MEIVCAALAIYALECLTFVPAGAYAVVGLAGRLRALRGEGLTWLSPWPTDLAAVASGLPFEVTAESVYTALPLRRLRLGAEPVGRAARLHGALRVEALGALISLDGRRFLRARSREQAAWLAELLRELAAADPAARPAQARRRVRASLSCARLDAALARVERETRLAGRLCAGLLLALLGLLGLSAAPVSDAAWLAGAGGFAALDVLALAAVFRAHRRLYPEQRTERIELLSALALFPPALLRARETLARRALAPFHPAAFAARLGDRARLTEVLRAELSRLEHPVWDRRGPPAGERDARRRFLAACRDELLAFAERAGVTEPELRAARPARTPGAASYCPVCLVEYRPGVACCSDCGVATRPCAQAPAGV